MEPVLFIANIAPLRNKDIFDFFLKQIPEFRKEKIEKFTNNESKIQSLASFILLKIALIQNGYNDEIVFEYKKNSKPYLKDSNFYFNISHSGEYVICALANEEVGCDIEKKIDRNFSSLFLEIYSSQDLENHGRSKDDFYKVWSVKEAYLKYLGQGLGIHMRSISVDLCGIEKVNGKRYFYDIYNENYALAFVSGSEKKPIIKEIDFSMFLN